MWKLALLFPCYVSSLTVNQNNLIIAVVEKLHVTSCIIDKDSNSMAALEINLVKSLSNINVSLSYWDSQKIVQLREIYYNGGLMLVVVSAKALERLFPLKTGIQISTSLLDDLKRTRLAWQHWLVFWPEDGPALTSVAFIPYHAMVLVAYHTAEVKSYSIRSTYSMKSVTSQVVWGHWDGAGLETFNLPPQRPLNGVVLRRQHLLIETYSDYSPLLLPHQEIIDELGTILNISFFNLNVTDFFRYDVTEISCIMNAPSISALVGPVITIRANLFIKGLGENSLTRYYLHPFDRNLWIVIGAWMIVAILAISTIQNRQVDNIVLGWIENTCEVFEAFCFQGGSWDKGTPAARIARLSVWVTVCVTIPSYTAVIISFMTARQTYVPFKDIEGLFEDGRYKVIADKNTMVENLKTFSGRADKFFVPDDELPYSAREAIEKVCGGKYAYIGYGDIFLSLRAPCRIVKIEKPVMSFVTGVTFGMFSPIHRVLMMQLPKFWANGMMNKFQGKVDKGTVPWTADSLTETVDLELVRDLFDLLMYAAPCSILILLLEMLWSFRKTNIFTN